jgi:hypothetical protein
VTVPAKRKPLGPSYDQVPMHDRFPTRHAPARFEPREVLKRTGFRLGDEARASKSDLSSIGDGLTKLGAGDFTSSGGNLILTVLGGLLGLIMLDLLLSPRGASVTSAAIRWTGGALNRVVSPVDPLTSPGAGTPLTVAAPATATPSSPAVPAGGGAGAGGYVNPVPGATVKRVDQGVDLQGTPGQSVLAIGDATVTAVKSDPGGFGTAIYYTLLNGVQAGKSIYVGHAQALVKAGDQLAAGAPVARLLANPLGNATQPGWTEIGFATSGGAPANNGSLFKAFLDLLLGTNTKTSTNTTGGTTTVTGP